MSRTTLAKTSEVSRGWILVDLKDKVLGRASTVIANRLRGKHRPIFTPNVDTGDFVIVINASQVRLTGKKATDKIYHRHSGYPGGIKSISAGRLREKNPEQLIRRSVQGMLPKNRLSHQLMGKLHVYAGAEHPHAAQQPEVIQI